MRVLSWRLTQNALQFSRQFACFVGKRKAAQQRRTPKYLCYPCNPWLRFLWLCFISPSRLFSVGPRSEAESERHPTWDRFSILATMECARQPPARASPALLSRRPQTHSSRQCLMAIDISPLQGVFAGVHFPFGNTLIGLKFRRPSSSRPFLHR